MTSGAGSKLFQLDSPPHPRNKQIISYHHLVVPGGMRSMYWKFFGFPADSEDEIVTKEKVICSLCKIQMSYNGNTSNLRMHLRNKHKAQLEHLEASTPPYVPKSRSSQSRGDGNLKKLAQKKTATPKRSEAAQIKMLDEMSPEGEDGPSSAIKFITFDEADFEDSEQSMEYVTSEPLVEGVTYYIPEEEQHNNGGVIAITGGPEIAETLLTFVATEMLSPAFIESRGFSTLMGKLVPSVPLPSAKQLQEGVMTQHFLALKDIVTSEMEANDPISLTVEEWSGVDELRYFTISAHFLSDDQLTSRNLFTLSAASDLEELLARCFDEFKLTGDRVTAIVTATTDKVMIGALEDWSGLGLVPCFQYTLEQAALACFGHSEVAPIINKCRATVADLKVKKRCSKNVPDIADDSPKLWLTTFEMLKAFMTEKDALPEEFAARLKDKDWANLISVVDILSPFQVTVQTLQEESPAHLSLIKPLIGQLLNNYLQPKDNDGAFLRKIKNLLKSRLSAAYSSDTATFLHTATCLDPRFKHINYADEESAHVKESLKIALYKISAEEPPTTPPPEEVEVPKRKVSSMALLLGDLCPVKTERTPQQRSDLELSQFVTESSITYEENSLSWWKMNKSKFPTLAKLAKRYLCIPACVSPLYSLEPKARERLEKQRASIPPEVVDMVVFLHKNLA